VRKKPLNGGQRQRSRGHVSGSCIPARSSAATPARVVTQTLGRPSCPFGGWVQPQQRGKRPRRGAYEGRIRAVRVECRRRCRYVVDPGGPFGDHRAGPCGVASSARRGFKRRVLWVSSLRSCSTRLETRTKEFNKCASARPSYGHARNESNPWERSLRGPGTMGRSPSGGCVGAHLLRPERW
jgi:hypothetical protein